MKLNLQNEFKKVTDINLWKGIGLAYAVKVGLGLVKDKLPEKSAGLIQAILPLFGAAILFKDKISQTAAGAAGLTLAIQEIAIEILSLLIKKETDPVKQNSYKEMLAAILPGAPVDRVSGLGNAPLQIVSPAVSYSEENESAGPEAENFLNADKADTNNF